MPFRYAVKEETLLQEKQNYWEYDSYAVTYHLVPKDYAETHDAGYKQLVTAEGAALTDWVPLKRHKWDLTSIKHASRHPALTDFMGTKLSIGDYVVTHIKKHDNLQVCEVIGFVRQGKIRILPVDDIDQKTGILRFPTEIVQIPSTLLGEDPNGEWIPTEEELS